MAQLVKIKVTDYGGTDSIPILKRFIDSQAQKIQDDVNQDFPTDSPGRIMEGTANSTVMAAKGIGTDYTDRFQTYLVGYSVGVGADLEEEKTLDSEISGGGAASGVVVGANAKAIRIENFAGLDTSKLNIFVNFGKLSHDEKIRESRDVDGTGKIEMLNIGLHFNYLIKEGSGDYMVGWGGIRTHWGYEYNDTLTTYKTSIDRLFDESENATNLNGRVTGHPTFKISTQTHSIPLAVSSNVHFLQIFTLYGGLGTDISYGKARGEGVLDGDVSPVICTDNGFCGGGRLIQLQAQASADEDGTVKPLIYRGFAGLQLNIPYVRIFGQIDKAFGNDLIAANIGLRLAF